MPLPADLGVIGMPGCFLYCDVRRQETLGINNFRAFWSIEIPRDPSWVGREFYQQAIVLDETVPDIGVVMSDAMQGIVGPNLKSVDETFIDDLMLDKDRSTGSWGGGMGVFGLQGGDGRLGTFDYTDGVPLDVNQTVWEWRTDGQLIVSDEQVSNNWMNQDQSVGDGIFHFTDFLLPEGITLIFKGANPVRIFVRGKCDIRGSILANGTDITDLWDGKKFDVGGQPAPPLPQPGQPGSAGGPGAGAGGQGASTWSVGSPGSDVVLLQGHVYGGPSGPQLLTGGRGGPVVPAHGDPSQVDFTTPPPTAIPVPQDKYSQYTAGGGSGGGFLNPGQEGLAIQNGTKTVPLGTVYPPVPDPDFFHQSGPVVPPGVALDFLPRPSMESSDHYVVGGSGGGGGGSHALFARQEIWTAIKDPILFSSGAGGAGGGGAVALRIGSSLTTESLSLIQARGGSAADQTKLPEDTGTAFPSGIAAPGGGGSGGSIILLVDGFADLQGTLDVSPGSGGVARLDLPPVEQYSKYVYHTRGGDGSMGYVRLESQDPSPSTALLGQLMPTGSGEVGQVTEEWPLVAFQSRWYETNQIFAPEYHRYEIEAEIDGATEIFSDDPSYGVLAQHPDTPLAFYAQAADIVPGSGQILLPEEVRGWRQFVGQFGPFPNTPTLNLDNKNGFRWVLILDRSFGVDVVIKRVSIFFKP